MRTRVEICDEFDVAGEDGFSTFEDLTGEYPGIEPNFYCNPTFYVWGEQEWQAQILRETLQAHWNADTVSKYDFVAGRLKALTTDEDLKNPPAE